MTRLAVIAGVGPSMGLAIARRFAREGFTVALIARRQDSLDTYAAQLTQDGFTAYGYAADAGDFTGLAETLTHIEQAHGPASVMVYNAVEALSGAPSALDAESVMAAMRVNLGGAIIMTQAAARQMTNGGTLLFTGGGLALDAYTQYFQYAGLAVGKAALRNWALNAAAELKTQNIHAATVTIAGGGVDTTQVADLYWRLHQQTPDQWQTEIVFS